MRERVPDPFDEAGAARRDLLELPPLLHGQAEARRHGGPGRALPAPPRAGAGRQVDLEDMSSLIGGQAVLEGVMMRGPSNWAVAVRRPDGRISEVAHPVTSWAARRRWLRLPVIRGVVALGESLAIGFKAIAVSADYAASSEGEEDASEGLSTGYLIASFAVAIVFSIGLFKVSPLVLTELFSGYDTHSWQFVIIEGLLRVSLLIGYLALISLVPDLKRVFQYHAAEHKAINAYEAGDELTPEVVQ